MMGLEIMEKKERHEHHPFIVEHCVTRPACQMNPIWIHFNGLNMNFESSEYHRRIIRD